MAEGLLERLIPCAFGGGFSVFGGAAFKEVHMFNAIEHFIHPRQRIFLNVVNRVEIELHQTAIADIANIILHFLRLEALNAAHFKSEVDKRVLMGDDRLACLIQVALDIIVPNFRVFLHECVEQLHG